MSAPPRSVPLALAALAVTIVAGCGSPKVDANAPAESISPSARGFDPTPNRLSSPEKSGSTATPPTPAPTAAIEVSGGKIVSGPRLVEVAHGTRVTLLIRSDRTDEVHVHGYDKLYRITSGKPLLVTFTADIAGAFEVELHSGTLLCELRVR